MEIRDIAKNTIIAKGGIAKSADFVEAGMKNCDVVNLCNMGYLERVRHGYYRIADDEWISEEQQLAALIPEGIVSMESALFHYGYSDFTPRKWSITVPRTISRTKLCDDVLPLQIYYVKDEFHKLGMAEGNFNGVVLPVYDRERTICDCFKYRTTMDSELFNKAVTAYAKDENKNLANLSLYAKQLRVYKKVMELMEVLMNG